MTIRSLLSLVALVAFSTHAFAPHTAIAQDAGWKAGVAKIDVTPEGPVWLAGYAGRNHAAESKLHSLWAKALAIQDAQGNKGVMLTLDLCGIPRGMYDNLCAAMKDKHGLPRDAVFVNVSHTHCAPVVTGSLDFFYAMSDAERERVAAFSKTLERQMIEACDKALGDLQPATLHAGIGHCGFAVNRRDNNEAQIPELHKKGVPLKGAHDHDVPVLAVRDAKTDELKAVAFLYACHNTTMSFYQYSGDYAGFAMIALERDLPGVQAMFIAGCGADQNPLPRRELPLCEKYGEQLATSVKQALSWKMRPLAPELKMAHAAPKIEYDKLTTREELDKYAATTDQLRSSWAKRYLAKLETEKEFAKDTPYNLLAWRMGDQLFISLSGEVLVDYALRFKSEYGPRTWVSGYSLDTIAYIPARRHYAEGRYEVDFVFMYDHPADRWKIDTEDRIAEAVKGAVERVK